MPSSAGEGRKYSSEMFPGNFSAGMWPYSAVPWQQLQQFAYPLPLPFVVPQINPPWFPVDNLATSLPPKPKIKHDEDFTVFETTRPSRRYSDPGPAGLVSLRERLNRAMTDKGSPETNDDDTDSETQLFLEEARKDKLFNSLLRELQAARNLNRHLMLELHKTKLQLQSVQQENSDHQPGSITGLVRKLYDAHQVRRDVLAHFNRGDEFSYGRKNSYSSKVETDEFEHLLMKERESLLTRLQFTEKRIQNLRNPQWSSPGESHYFQKANDLQSNSMLRSSSSADVLASSKLSRCHSFLLNSPSSSDPPSLDDVDITSSNSKHGCTANPPSSNPHRLLPEGRSYSSGMPSGDSLKRNLEQQLASVERDRRQLQLELQDSLNARRISEDRVLKLERLVSVLRKKLEPQTGMNPTFSNGQSMCSVTPSPVENNLTHPEFNFTNGKSNSRLTHSEGPNSLPAYVQVVGPITQL